jgi:hypothetical protein
LSSCPVLAVDSVVKRFTNKRAKDFNPSSLKEYGRRVHRARDLDLNWREDPAIFSVKARATTNARKKDRSPELAAASDTVEGDLEVAPRTLGTYQTALPVRPGVVITTSNIPHDLSSTEAERLASFVKMLAVDPEHP